MASFTKYGVGWRAQVCINGKRKSKTFQFKADAQRWAREVESVLSKAPAEVGSSKTMAELWDEWSRRYLDKRKYALKEQHRLNFYRSDPLAQVRLSHVTGKHIAEWRDRSLTRVSPATVNRDWNFLSGICTVGIKEIGWLAVNPFSQATRPPPTKARSRIISDDELEALKLTLSPNVWAVVEFAIETAMRAGEICGLTWEHVDLAKRTAYLPETKNGHSRYVPLSTRAVELLGSPGVGSVFNQKASRLDAVWRKGRDRAGLVDVHFHDTRHTAITRLARKLPVLALARMVGHRDIRQLQVYYNESAEELAKLLD